MRICSTLSATLRRKSPSSAFAISSASGSLSSVIGVPSAGVQSSNSTIAGPPNDHLIPTPGASANFHHQRGLYRQGERPMISGSGVASGSGGAMPRQHTRQHLHRLADGCCPIHGAPMAQVGAAEDGTSLVVKCTQVDC